MDKSFTAFCRGLEGPASVIVGRPIHIRSVPLGNNNVAYTMKGDTVYISDNHPIFKGLPLSEKRIYQKGIIFHELMHQLITDFDFLNSFANKLDKAEATIFVEIQNAIEDPAIEWQAPGYAGGSFLRCLRLVINYTYKISPDVDPSRRPFEQFMSALIHYGDGGFVKGKIADDQAREIFHKVLPMVDDIITDTDGKSRIKKCFNVYMETKPLWENDVKDLANNLKKLMDKLGKSANQSGASGSDTKPDESKFGSASGSKMKKRKITYKKVSKEELDRMKKEAEGADGNIPDDGDVTIYYSDEDSDKDKNGEGAPSPFGPKSETETAVNSNSMSDETEDQNQDSDSEETDSTGSDQKRDEAAPEDQPASESGETAADDANKPEDKSSRDTRPPIEYDHYEAPEEDEAPETEFEDDELEITPEDLAGVEEQIQNGLDILSAENQESAQSAAAVFDCELPPGYRYRAKKCVNVAVKPETSGASLALYQATVASLQSCIDLCYDKIKRMLKQPPVQKIKRDNGRVNVKALASGRKTTMVFSRHKAPGQEFELALLILVDESGSMMINMKDAFARNCTIALAEIFSKLGIPIKIIGFTADSDEYDHADAVHFHYVNWQCTSVQERAKLMSIKARDDNFDGYSIRYATEVLKRRKERHKLMVVISDGQPAAFAYGTYGNKAGVLDTTNAIADARKSGIDVVGIGVGDADTAILFKMYQDDFVQCSNPADLFRLLTDKLIAKIRRWLY